MTVAEVDALLYLPGHSRQQLLRALRISALSPGWQASFRALLDGEPGVGNAGLAVTSPPAAWPGFRRLTVAGIERESDSVISIRLRGSRRRRASCGTSWPVPHATNPARERAAIGAPELLTVGTTRRRLLPHHRQARARRRRQRLSAHPARRRRRARHRGAPRHVHPRPHACARAADQRRHRRNASPRHASRAGAGAFRSGRSGGCTARAAAATTASPPRRARCFASLPNVRTHVYYSRPGSDDRERRDFERAGRLSASLLAELDPPRDAQAYLCGPTPFMEEISAGLAAIGLAASHIHTEPFGPAPGLTPGIASTPARAPHPPQANSEAARPSNSRAATSPSRGAATTRACSNSPKPATYPSGGRAAPASATTARRRSSQAPSTTTPTQSNPPPMAARLSAAHGRTTTW